MSCFEVPITRLLGRTDESYENDKSRWLLSVPRLQHENCYPVHAVKMAAVRTTSAA
jgi:hypothetical protein